MGKSRAASLRSFKAEMNERPSAPPALPPGEPPPTAIGMAIGLLLTLAGAAILAFSMVVQRYALAYPSRHVPILFVRVHRNVAWLLGLLLYILANGFKVVALGYGPLTVLSSIFTTLLIFNLFFAKWLLRERITPPKVVGAALIILGGCVVCAGTPGLTGGSPPPTTFTSSQIAALLLLPAPKGIFFCVLLLLLVVTSVFAITRHEKRYPARTIIDESLALQADNFVEEAIERSSVAARWSVRRLPLDLLGARGRASFERQTSFDSYTRADAGPTPAESEPAAADELGGGCPGEGDVARAPTRSFQRSGTSAPSHSSKGSVLVYSAKAASPRLAALMLLVYPGSLGLDETLSDLCTRAYVSILTSCVDGPSNEGVSQGLVACLTVPTSWTFFLGLLGGIIAGLASTFFWMRIVYRRYETTVALPIEYGALNVGNLLSGLLFYDEGSYMEAWQVGLALVGCCIILLGIGVGQMSFGQRLHKVAPNLHHSESESGLVAASQSA